MRLNQINSFLKNKGFVRCGNDLLLNETVIYFAIVY